MKFKTLIVFLFVIQLTYSQKTYSFDYLLTYEFNIYKDSVKIKNHPFRERDEKITRYYLTNSKNNEYLATITEKDSLNYKLVFKDNNGIYINITVLKSELNNAERIKIDCGNVFKYVNRYKFQTKNYDFTILKDTLINNTLFSQHKLISIKPKRKKRKKLGSEIYVIDKSTNFHLPMLKHATAYEEWKLHQKLPNGILVEKIFINYFGKISEHEKLVTYEKINKTIIIPEDCDYTNKSTKSFYQIKP